MNLTTFKKRNNFLVCVDSDGCAMDTMDVKHFHCFGPCMIKEWGLKQWQDEILPRWNEINLYTMTRGINRFKGLALVLTEIDEKYCKIQEVAQLNTWVKESDELSNDALKRAIKETDSIALKKALNWSISVNESITKLPEGSKLPFDGVKEALAFAHQYADVAIVSSANSDAVLEEWEQHGLLPHTDIVLAQNAGSKAYCIQELKNKGYDPRRVVMCGDAPGDLQAAEKNGVFFFPILVRKEKESWEEFINTAFAHLKNGTYGGAYQKEKILQFRKNLGE